MKQNHLKLLFLLFIISIFFRTFRLSQPKAYVFDEVYHTFTAQEMAKGNQHAWEWWVPSPPGVAYEWTHPPLAKLAMAGSISLLGDRSFAWRFPSAVFGTLSVAVVYFIGKQLFKNNHLALLAAAIFSFDGLQLTMSRVGMADSLLTLLMLLACLFFYQSKFRLTGIFLGLALATKWSAVLLYPVFGILLLPKIIKNTQKVKFFFQLAYSFLLTPLVIYFLTFIPFFNTGHTLAQWWELQRQMYYYHSHLNATHQYQSMAWQWPLLVRPVWFYVDYAKNSIANIYNLGNPAIFWGGLVALFFSRNFTLLISYFLLFFPFVFSPRIMFLHHYLPALPFLCLIIAQAIYQHKLLAKYYLLLVILLFLFFYPLNTAISLPVNLVKYWFWLPTWK
ncbi:MAG: phospholipid carrier-dependent glycosyltransferase [Candidatus Beckwithbacteria bacterium]